jgi:hypothetical protein
MIRILCLAVACGLAAAVLVAGAPATTAAGATTTTSAQYTATVPFAVSSITVSPQTGSFRNCTGGSGGTSTTLALPNGTCVANVTVTEGGGSAYIYADSGNATAADGGDGWDLCVPESKVATPTCSNSSNASAPGGGLLPGTDQFALRDFFSGGTGWLGSTSACLPIGGQQGTTSCSSLSGSSAAVPVTIYGPSESTDDSSSFSLTITFTVVPG